MTLKGRSRIKTAKQEQMPDTECADGIILDESYTDSLLKSLRYSSIDKVPERTRSQYSESLFALLMYGKVWLSSDLRGKYLPCRNEKLGTMLSEDMADFIPRGIIATHRERIEDLHSQVNVLNSIEDAEFYLDYAISSLGLLKELVWAYYLLKKKGQPQFCVEELMDFRELTDLFRNLPLPFEYDDPVHSKDEVRQDIQWVTQQDALDTMESAQIWEKRDLEDILITEYSYPCSKASALSRTELIKELVRNDRKILKRDYARDWEHILFVNSYAKLKELLDFSSHHTIPMKSIMGNLPQSKDVQRTRVDSDLSYSVYKIILEEVQYMPHLRNLDDVRRLRDDKRIVSVHSVLDI